MHYGASEIWSVEEIVILDVFLSVNVNAVVTFFVVIVHYQYRIIIIVWTVHVSNIKVL